MLGFGILLIIVGILAVVFGMLQNTILFNLFADLNARLERANLDEDFHIARLFDGPGTIVLFLGILLLIIGIVLIALKRKRSRKIREINRNIKHTNKRRKQQGKRERR